MEEFEEASSDFPAKVHSVTDVIKAEGKVLDIKSQSPVTIEEISTNVSDVVEYCSEKFKETKLFPQSAESSEAQGYGEIVKIKETEGSMVSQVQSESRHLASSKESNSGDNGGIESQLVSSMENEQKPVISISFMSADSSRDSQARFVAGQDDNVQTGGPSDISSINGSKTPAQSIVTEYNLEDKLSESTEVQDRTTYRCDMKEIISDDKQDEVQAVPLEVSVVLKDSNSDANRPPQSVSRSANEPIEASPEVVDCEAVTLEPSLTDEENVFSEKEPLLPQLRSRFKKLPEAISKSSNPKRMHNKCPKKSRSFYFGICRICAYLLLITSSTIVIALSIASLAVNVQLKQEIYKYHENFRITSCYHYLSSARSSNTTICTCATLKEDNPSLESGYYTLLAANGSVVHGYCDMTLICGGVMGWMRVAHLDTRNVTASCPEGFLSNKTTFANYNPLNESCQLDYLRTCVMESDLPHSCSSTIYPTGIDYSKVCGRIIGYQFGSPDGFIIPESDDKIIHSDLSRPYVDGVTLTYGTQQHHIWTFAAAYNKEVLPDLCYCDQNENITDTNENITDRLGFIGEHYFCDSAVGQGKPEPRLYINPLWDGHRCDDESSACCSSGPWFYQQLPLETNNEIQMTMCRDESRSEEDIGIQIVDILIH